MAEGLAFLKSSIKCELPQETGDNGHTALLSQRTLGFNPKERMDGSGNADKMGGEHMV